MEFSEKSITHQPASKVEFAPREPTCTSNSIKAESFSWLPHVVFIRNSQLGLHLTGDMARDMMERVLLLSSQSTNGRHEIPLSTLLKAAVSLLVPDRSIRPPVSCRHKTSSTIPLYTSGRAILHGLGAISLHSQVTIAPSSFSHVTHQSHGSEDSPTASAK